MNTLRLPTFLLLALVLIISSGCSLCGYFVEGLRVMVGKGGTHARHDAYQTTIDRANAISVNQPETAWEVLLHDSDDDADLIHFIDDDRVLVGTVHVTAFLGEPKHAWLTLYDANSGVQLWKYKCAPLPNGSYSVVLNDPVILVAGRTPGTVLYTALDPKSGQCVWERQLKAPGSYALSPDLRRIFFLVQKDGAGEVSAVDIRSGEVNWQKDLPEGSCHKDYPAQLVLGDTALFTVGRTLQKIAFEDGRLLGSLECALLTSDEPEARVVSSGLLIWSARAMALVDQETCALRWTKNVSQRIELVSAGEEQSYCVLTPPSPDGNARDVIAAINTGTGREIWRHDLSGRLASPLSLRQGHLFHTLDDALIAFDSATGKELIHKRLPEEFIAVPPSSEPAWNQPDIIRFEGIRLHVSRENAGIATFSLPDAELKALQVIPRVAEYPYTYGVNERWEFLRQKIFPMLKKVKISATPDKTTPAGTVGDADKPLSRYFLVAEQRDYDMSSQYLRQWQLNTMNPNATPASRAEARRRMDIAEERGQSFLESEIAMQRSQAQTFFYAATLSAVGDMGMAFVEAAQRQAEFALVQRKQMELKASLRSRRASFQGKYHARPFATSDYGVALVDLTTGKRCDFMFAPYCATFFSYAVELPVFAISPDGNRLITAGIGLRTDRYEPHVKWQWRLPRSSLLAYDLRKLKFTSTIDKPAAGLAPPVVPENVIRPHQRPSHR